MNKLYICGRCYKMTEWVYNLSMVSREEDYYQCSECELVIDKSKFKKYVKQTAKLVISKFDYNVKKLVIDNENDCEINYYFKDGIFKIEVKRNE